MTLLIIGFLLVFLLGLQQQNVTHEKHAWSVVTSYAIAVVQVLLIKEAVASDWVGALLLGTGGALGASASMVAHRMMREKCEAMKAINEATHPAIAITPLWMADLADHHRVACGNPPPTYDKPPAPPSPPRAVAKRHRGRKTKRRIVR